MASFADKNQNSVHKAKVDKSESGALMRKVEIVGNNIVDAYEEANVKRKEFLASNDNALSELNDYIFGKSDINPMEDITSELYDKISEQKEKTDNLVETYKFVNR